MIGQEQCFGDADALQTGENNLQAVKRILAAATTPPLLQSHSTGPIRLNWSNQCAEKWNGGKLFPLIQLYRPLLSIAQLFPSYQLSSGCVTKIPESSMEYVMYSTTFEPINSTDNAMQRVELLIFLIHKNPPVKLNLSCNYQCGMAFERLLILLSEH